MELELHYMVFRCPICGHGAIAAGGHYIRSNATETGWQCIRRVYVHDITLCLAAPALAPRRVSEAGANPGQMWFKNKRTD